MAMVDPALLRGGDQGRILSIAEPDLYGEGEEEVDS